MFELIIFSIISFIIIFFIFKILLKQNLSMKQMDIVFIIGSLLTLIIHYIPVFVDIFSNNFSFKDLGDTYFLPVYPCNVMMWVNVVLIFLIKRKNLVFHIFGEFSFLMGTICGIIGLLFNANFLNNPNFFDIDILKGLVSHVTLIFTCLSLFVFKMIKIRTLPNLRSCTIGLIVLIICNLYSNFILKLLHRDPIDALFMSGNPYGIPFLNLFTMVILSLILEIVVTTIFEIITLPRENRWYYLIKQKLKKGSR